MSYLREVARAVADEDPELSKIARRALGQIEAQIQMLRAESDTIRRLADHVAALQGATVRSDPPVDDQQVTAPLAQEDEFQGLSDAEKEQINRLIDVVLVHEPGVTVEALVTRIEAEGLPVSDRVSRPASVVGSMLYHARKRLHPTNATRIVFSETK